MQPTEEFTGLGMPVFTAFGWAGEEAAQKYAYSQLEQFIALLHTNLSANLQKEMIYYGLSPEDQSVYLAAAENVEEDVHIAFNARPLSFEIQLALTDKPALNRALKQIKKNPQIFLILLKQLDPDWEFRIQQVQIDEDSGDQAHYQDLYKGPIAGLNEENVVEIFEKASYLNGDDKWVTPIYLSMRLPADQAAAMQYLEQSAAFSMISIDLTPDILSQPLEVGGWQPQGVARSALETLIATFQTLVEVAIWLVIYVLPLALIVAIPVWLIIRFFRRRRADRRVEADELPPENATE